MRGAVILLLFVCIICCCCCATRGEHDIEKREHALLTTPPPTVLLDTREELETHFIALYILFPICLIECCIGLPVVLGLVLGICATVPGCKMHKSLTKKAREDYILEQEAQMAPPIIFPATTIYPGNMTAELPAYDEYAFHN